MKSQSQERLSYVGESLPRLAFGTSIGVHSVRRSKPPERSDVTRFLLATVCWSLFLPAVLLADPPQTGPETEKRFPPLKVPEGFKATLFACDPLIEYPSAIALGPRANTLFVAVDYMTGLGTTDIIQRDEIRLVADTDGDGYADRAPIWADGFNSIQGLTYHDGTVFVMHAPYLTALRDIDGDGMADERKNLFKGFGLGPEEDKVRLHNSNGIVAGHDGWLYLALGDRGCDVVRPEGDLLVLNGGGILRCRPDGRDLHVFSTGLRNIYDVALDDDLNVFTRDNENDGGNYKIRVCQSFFGADHGYPYLYDERPDEALAPLADLKLGSSAGGVYYRETQFPAEYRGLYFCEWGRAVMRYSPESPGKAFSPVKEIEFASGAENDPYGFKPTDLVVDRDGSLLIADWADGQRPKRGRARVYRVQYVGHVSNLLVKSGQFKNLPRRIAVLFEQLNSDRYYERLDAQLAIERLGRDDPAAAAMFLKKAYENLNGVARLHYVWILTHVFDKQASEELFSLARSPDRRVQTQAIRAISDLYDPVLVAHRLDAEPTEHDVAKRLSGLVGRFHYHVKMEVVVAIGRLKWNEAPLWIAQNLPLMTPVDAHAVQQTLRRCGNWGAVMTLLNGSVPELPPQIRQKLKRDSVSNPLPSVSLRTAALRALKDHSNAEIVDGLDARLRLETDSVRRLEYAYVLCRVHRKPPAQWVHWGFRPAPRPANTVVWERTELIEQALDRLLADDNHEVRFAVLKRMQRENIPTRLMTLAAWAREETGVESFVAILDSLREHPAEATREVLELAIADVRKPDDARLAAFRLWTVGANDSPNERLLALAKSMEDGAVLADILREFGARGVKSGGTPAMGNLLLAKTNSDAATVRAAAIEALARLSIADAAGPLPKLLRDEDARVRRAAAFAAGQLQASANIAALLDLARDADVLVRQASLESLRQLHELRVVPLAVDALSDGTTQLSAMRCLAEFGGPDQASAVIAAASRNSSAEVLSLALQMLSKCASQAGLAAARRVEFEQAMCDLQESCGLLLRWRISEPLSADDATKAIASLDTADKTAMWRTVFGIGPEARVGHVSNVPMKDGQVGNLPHGTRLAFTEFNSTESATAQFLMSSNGALKVWLNGKPVFERAEARRFQADGDRFEAEFAKGTNRLLLQLGDAPAAALEFHARIRRKSSKAEHERLVEAALSRAGNVERGRKLFLTVEKSNCLKCHRLGEQGEKIGPELTGIGSRFSRIHIIESLLDPSRTIAAGFQSQTVAMQDGRVLSGLKVSETADTLVLADNQGKKHSLLKADIEESQAHVGSIMPDGLEKTLTVDEFVDLISFLTSEKQTAGR